MSDDSAGLSANSSLLLQNTASLLFLQQSAFGQNAIDDYLKQTATSASTAEERRSQESSSPGSRQSPYSIETILRSNSDASSIKLSGNVKKQETNDNGASSSDNGNANDGSAGEVMCAVCNDIASGQHYGASTCFGCKGFFRRVLRQNKVFVCRYEGQCQIDKVGRNACRSCRFKKCLEVGMDVTAIRPDRDKTGRQKNPRRSTSHSMRSDDMPMMHTDDEGLPMARSNRSPEDDVSSNDGDRDLRSHCENPAMVAERDLVLQTLCEIERICYQLVDANQAEPLGDPTSITDVIAQPSLLTPRTQLDYSGTNALSGSHEYAEALKRLLVLAVDYANTLKPIADLGAQEKAALLQSFAPSFVILTSAYQSLVQARIDQILLPNGAVLDDANPVLQELSTKWGEEKLVYFMEKYRRLFVSMKAGLQMSIAKLDLTEIEYVTLKAILALDTNTPDVSKETAEILAVARESVQNALYLHLLEKYPATHAISRFGRILMLTASISKLGAQLGQLVHLCSEVFPEVGGVVAQLVS